MTIFWRCLSNIAHHAWATTVQVTVAAAGRDLVLRVEDNGVSLPAEAGQGGGNGLANMVARAVFHPGPMVNCQDRSRRGPLPPVQRITVSSHRVDSRPELINPTLPGHPRIKPTGKGGHPLLWQRPRPQWLTA